MENQKNKFSLKKHDEFDILIDFFEKQYLHIYIGKQIKKINFRTNRAKIHYYRIDNETDDFQVLKKNNSNKVYKKYDFINILKISVGIRTKNLQTKINKLKILKNKKNRPYLFISLYINTGRTVDLIFENSIAAKKWFYGLHYYLSNYISKRPYKICSCTNFILLRIKSKLFNLLNLPIKKMDDITLSQSLNQFFGKKEKINIKNEIEEEEEEDQEEVEEDDEEDEEEEDKEEEIKEKIKIFEEEKENRKNENNNVYINNYNYNFNNNYKDYNKYRVKANYFDNNKNINSYSTIINEENIKNEKINKTLENMCILGNITKKEIIKEKKKNPEKFIETKQALKLEHQDEGLFALGLISKNLEDLGIETAIEKNINEKDEYESSTTFLQYLINGYIQKRKYDLHFDFGENRNEEILNNKNEYEKFKKRLKQKLSKDYFIPENKIIITNPQKGSLKIQLVFQSDDFNNLDLTELKNKFKLDDEFPELKKLKEIHSDAIMGGCKLSKSMLDPKGNRFEGWPDGEKRGGMPYYSPKGWIGIGLNVLNKFDNGDNRWIGMINGPGEWCVAYHGVGRNKSSDIVKSVIKNIYIGGFKSGSNQVHENHENINKKGTKVGTGVYCTPNVETARIFSGKCIINGKNYYTVLMVRVKTSARRQCSCPEASDYWVVNGTFDEIRPYRILYKEV